MILALMIRKRLKMSCNISVIPEEVPSDRESDIEDQCPEPDMDTTQQDTDTTDQGLIEYDDDFEDYDSSEVLNIVVIFLGGKNLYLGEIFCLINCLVLSIIFDLIWPDIYWVLIIHNRNIGEIQILSLW